MLERARRSGVLPTPDMLRGTAWLTAATGMHAASQWARLGIAARLVAPAGIGHYALAMAIVGPVFQLTGLQLRTVIASSDRSPLRRGALYGVRALTGGVGLALAIGVSWLNDSWRPAVPVVAGVAFARAADGLLEVDQGLAERLRQFGRSAGLTALRAILGLLGFVTGLVVSGGRMDAATTGGGLAVLVLWGAVAQVGRGEPESPDPDRRSHGAVRRFRLSKEGSLAMGASPLGVAMLLSTLNGSIPQFVVQDFLGTVAGGTYLLVMAPGVAGAMILAGLGQSSVPSLGSAWSSGDRTAFAVALRRLAVAASLVGFAGVTLAVVAGPALLRLFYGPGFADQRLTFALAMGSAAIGYVGSVAGYGLTATGTYRGQVGQMSTACLATLVASVIGVRLVGIAGAVIGAGVGLLVQALLGASLLRGTPWPAVPVAPGWPR